MGRRQTGSPPCQPFSNAGKQKAQADARHLWPVFFNLVRECNPSNIFGEQVEAAIRTGWLDDLQDDLEAEGYATGKVILPACSVGGFHIRQRIWFVAERLADTDDTRPQGRAGMSSADELASGAGSLVGGLADTDSERYVGVNPLLLWEESRRVTQDCAEVAGGGKDGGLADSESSECQFTGRTRPRRKGLANDYCDSRTNAPETFWANPDWLFCRDGKWRPVESEVQRVVDGLSDELVRSCNIRSASYPLAKDQEARVMRLKGYGNAIAAPLAAEFIKAYLSIDFGNA